LAVGSAPLARAEDVGSGAPDDTSRQEFVRAFYRNGFSQKVSTPPLGEVKPLGTTGLVQEFQDAAKTPGIKFALVMPNKAAQPQADAVTIFHVYGDIYGYYSSLGVSTVGYPTADTTACPSLASNSCNYQLFDKPYALFVYAAALPNGQNFSVRNPFLDAWKLKGGVANLGPPVDTEPTVTASSGNTATKQEYKYGAIYSITSGLNASREPFAVGPPIYDLYVNNRA